MNKSQEKVRRKLQPLSDLVRRNSASRTMKSVETTTRGTPRDTTSTMLTGWGRSCLSRISVQDTQSWSQSCFRDHRVCLSWTHKKHVGQLTYSTGVCHFSFKIWNKINIQSLCNDSLSMLATVNSQHLWLSFKIMNIFLPNSTFDYLDTVHSILYDTISHHHAKLMSINSDDYNMISRYLPLSANEGQIISNLSRFESPSLKSRVWSPIVVTHMKFEPGIDGSFVTLISDVAWSWSWKEAAVSLVVLKFLISFLLFLNFHPMVGVQFPLYCMVQLMTACLCSFSPVLVFEKLHVGWSSAQNNYS